MGYRIVYGGPEPKSRIRTSTTARLRTLLAAVFLFFCLTVRLLWPEGTTQLRSTFLPGDLSVTEEAFSELVADLRDGHTLGDTLTVFCRKIIHETS